MPEKPKGNTIKFAEVEGCFMTAGQMLVLHAERITKPGVGDPGHTSVGLARLRGIRLPEEVSEIFYGTGFRHREMFYIIRDVLKERMGRDVPSKICPLVGTGDALNAGGETITLCNGDVIYTSQYYSIIEAAALGGNIRACLPRDPGILFLGGTELFKALGGKTEIKQPGGIYFLPIDTSEVLLIE